MEVTLNFNELDKYFADVEYLKLGKKTTICLITTTFGMEVVGVVHCQDANKYSFDLGKEQALNKAKDNAFPLILAYLKNV